MDIFKTWQYRQIL